MRKHPRWSIAAAFIALVCGSVVVFSASTEPKPGKSDWLILRVYTPWETYEWENGLPETSPETSPILKAGQTYSIIATLANCTNGVPLSMCVGGEWHNGYFDTISTTYTAPNEPAGDLLIDVYAADPDGGGPYVPPDALSASLAIAKPTEIDSDAENCDASDWDRKKAWGVGTTSTWTATLTNSNPDFPSSHIPAGFLQWTASGNPNVTHSSIPDSDEIYRQTSLSEPGVFTFKVE